MSMEADTSPTGLNPSKKYRGKVPTRVHKAEREKMKREHLNELFIKLADTLELTEPNTGKASILGETTRVVKDMLEQIECLKKENVALLSESHYVTVEKNELQDENSALQVLIGESKTILKERTVQSNLDLNVPPIESEDFLKLPSGDPSLQQAPIINPVFVIPPCLELQVHPNPASPVLGTTPISNVTKPHPRYPTPADSWPFQLLENHTEVGKGLTT